MMSFVGSLVSMDCGEILGTYQGEVTAIEQQTQTLTIVKPFRNGVPYKLSQLTVNAADIHDLKILKTKEEVKAEGKRKPLSRTAIPARKPTNSSTSDYKVSISATTLPAPVLVTKSNTGQRLGPTDKGSSGGGISAHMKCGKGSPRHSPHSNSGNYSGSHVMYDHQVPFGGLHASEDRYSPVKGALNGNESLVYTQNKYEDNHQHRTESISDSQQVNKRSNNTTPRKERGDRRTPHEDCFSAPVEAILTEDFDFEKNLALFNKEAVFTEIEHQGYPKIVRPNGCQGKFRCDENVLPSKPIVYEQIKVPDGSAARQFVTDAGLVVPSVTPGLREKLLIAAERCGLSRPRQVEMVGRSASEMVLQLIGGSTRLNPQNAHQRPSVIVLCGPHHQGAQGVNCARHLVSHGVQVTTFVPQLANMPEYLQEEIQLLDLTACSLTSTPTALPFKPVDMIVNALDSHEDHCSYSNTWYDTIVDWTTHSKAPVLAVDPPPEGGPISTKWSLGVALPLSATDKCGQLYLCDLSIPARIYSELGITYNSPFGHKFVVPLHSS